MDECEGVGIRVQGLGFRFPALVFLGVSEAKFAGWLVAFLTH